MIRKAMAHDAEEACIAYAHNKGIEIFGKTELTLKIACAEEMKRCLIAQKKRYPLMNEEDVVKFAFQGMLGVGHLIHSEEDAMKRLQEEMDGLEPNNEEPYIEKISSEWLRMNLRAAKARQIREADIAHMLCQSAQRKHAGQLHIPAHAAGLRCFFLLRENQFASGTRRLKNGRYAADNRHNRLLALAGRFILLVLRKLAGRLL